MGLDAFMFKISRPEHLDKECYTVKEIDSLGLVCIPFDALTPPNRVNLQGYVKVLMVENLYYDLDKIRAEYGLSEDAHIGAIMGDGSVDVTERLSDGNYNRVSISKEEIKEKFVLRQKEKCYVFRREAIQKWRNDCDISDFFGNEIGPIENTSYYPVDPKLAALFNHYFNQSIPTRPMPEGTGLFYYEWF